MLHKREHESSKIHGLEITEITRIIERPSKNHGTGSEITEMTRMTEMNGLADLRKFTLGNNGNSKNDRNDA